MRPFADTGGLGDGRDAVQRPGPRGQGHGVRGCLEGAGRLEGRFCRASDAKIA